MEANVIFECFTSNTFPLWSTHHDWENLCVVYSLPVGSYKYEFLKGNCIVVDVEVCVYVYYAVAMSTYQRLHLQFI